MEEFFYDETKYIKRQDLKEYVELMLPYDFMPEYIEDGNEFNRVFQYLVNLTLKAPDFIVAYEYALSMLELFESDEDLITQSAEEDFIIKQSTDGRSYFRANTIKIVDFQTKEERSEFRKGGTIFYNVEGSDIPVQDNPKSPFSVFKKSGMFSLFHELGHGEDYLDEEKRSNWDTFTDDKKGQNGLSRAEWSATFIENEIRNDLNAPLRTNYLINETQQGLFVLPPRLIKVDDKGVRSLWKEKSEHYFIKF